jgi:uncharacterized protein (TIGR02145 family)
MELDWTRPDQKVSFTWDTQDLDPATEYSIVFSSRSDMSSGAVAFPAGATNTWQLTHDQLQQTALGYASHPFKPVTAYWNIKDNASGDFLSRTSRTLTLTPMMRFTDVRGDETITYPVVKISYQDGSEQYWLAENLRATKYPDGTAIGSDVMFASGGSLTPEQIHIFGGYYTPNPDMMSRLPSEDWKIPTWEECQKLYAAANSAYSPNGVVCLFDPVYFNDSWAKSLAHIGAWGLNLVSSGQEQNWSGVVTNTSYCYLMANGIGENTNRGAMFALDGLWEPWNTKVPVRMLYTK